MFSTIQLIKKNPTPLYLQLANGLSRFIQNGNLTAGTKLPPIRGLAKELRINRDTVVSAYKVLEQRGLVYGQTGSGTYVSPLSTPSAVESCPPENENFINFTTLSLPLEYYPIEKLEYIVAQILTHEGWDAFHDGDGSKYVLFKEAICQYLHGRSIRCTPRQVRVMQDISRLFHSLEGCFSPAGICIESPSKDFTFLHQWGFKTFEIPLEQDGMNIDLLELCLKEQHIQYVYLMPYLQNPTGICYSTEKKLRLIELSHQYNFYIIEEDTYNDLLLDPTTTTPLYSHFSSDRVIYIHHFSKLYLPKLPSSFIVLPHSLVDILADFHTYSFTDALVHYYLEKNICHSSHDYIIQSCKQKYMKLLELIRLYLYPHLYYHSSFGGLYVWLVLNCPPLTMETLCDQLLSQSVIVSPGSLFYMSSKKDMPYIRISIASVTMTELQKGIAILSHIIKNTHPPLKS